MVKYKYKGFSSSSSSISSISSGPSLQKFPTELLFMIFQDFDIPTLINVCNVCKRFQQIGTEILTKKFQDPDVELILAFEQECRWKDTVAFEFSKFNEKSGKFIFKPKPKEQKQMRFIHSFMIRSPVLSKVSINKAGSEDVSKHNKLEKNLLQNSLVLNIKSQKDTLKKVQHVYRIGHGTTHLKIPYTFTYSITDTPPPLAQMVRGGERWLTPISFECAPGFFYPRESTAHKIIMTIMHLRKKNLLKKKSSSSSSQISIKQKQKAVNFDEKSNRSYFNRIRYDWLKFK